MSKRYLIPVAAMVLVAVLALSSVQSSDADSVNATKVVTKDVTLDADYSLSDGDTIIINSGVTIDIGTYKVTIGTGCTVQLLGDAKIVSSGGTITVGSDSKIIFGTDTLGLSFPCGDRTLTLSMNGTLEFGYTYAVLASTITTKYTSSGSDLTLSAVSGDETVVTTFDRLEMTYTATPGGQEAVSKYLSSSSMTLEEFFKEFGTLDAVRFVMSFGTFTVEDRTASGSGYTYERLEMRATASGTNLDFTLSSRGVAVLEFELDSVTIVSGNSSSNAYSAVVASGFNDPKISVNAAGYISISAELDNLSIYSYNGSAKSGVDMTGVTVSGTMKLTFDETDIDGNVSIKVLSARVYSTTGEEFTLTSIKITAAVVDSVFTELWIEATYNNNLFTFDASGFKLDITQLESGNYDVTMTIDTVTITYGGYTLTLKTVTSTIKNLNTDLLIQRFSENGSLGVQDLVDSSDSMSLNADTITLSSGESITMNSASIDLSKDTDWNTITICLGSASGSITTSDGSVELTMSPTTLMIKSTLGTLGSVFDAVTKGYTFTCDTTAVLSLETQKIILKDTSTADGTTTVTEFNLAPDSGTESVTLVFSMQYTKSSNTMEIDSALDMSNTTLSVSVTKVVQSQNISVVSLSMHNAKGSFKAIVSTNGSDTSFTVTADLTMGMELKIFYHGISCNLTSTNASVSLNPFSFTLKGYDVSAHGLSSTFSAIPDHDFSLSASGKMTTSKLTLDTIWSSVSSYSDVTVSFNAVSVDMNRGDSVNVSINELKVTGKDQGGKNVDVTVSGFHYRQSLKTEVYSDTPMYVLLIVFVIATALVWCAIAYTYGYRKAAEGGETRKV